MGLFKKNHQLNKKELETLHSLLSDLYNGKKKFKTTELDDCLHLRMRIKEVLDNLS